MLQFTPQMRLLVCVEPIDFRDGIDGLVRVCRETLAEEPFCGAVFVYRKRRATSIYVLAYDVQGFWLCQERLSTGRFNRWPDGGLARTLAAHELPALLSAGDPRNVNAPAASVEPAKKSRQESLRNRRSAIAPRRDIRTTGGMPDVPLISDDLTSCQPLLRDRRRPSSKT